MHEFKRQGLLRKDPRLEADRCLIKDLKSSKVQGEEIISLGNYNPIIYNSQLATILTGPVLNMQEQYKLLYNKEAPNSRISGQLPITGCFGTT